MAKDWLDQGKTEKETKSFFNPMCTANGCPNAGSLSHSIKGGGPWMCSHHFREPDPKNWDKITQKVRQEYRKEESDELPLPF